MCGRYVIEDFQELSETLRQVPFQSMYDPNPTWNAAPSQKLPVIIEADGTLQLRPLHWGLIPSWVKPGEKPKVTPINARSETVAEKPMFRNLVKRHRCLVPANGFYEWKKIGSGKQPYYIHPTQGPYMLFAGLFDVRTDDDGERQGSYTILTGESNHTMAELHDRMPIIIQPDDVELWMDPDITELEPLQHLLHPAPDEAIDIYPVDPKVGNVRNNAPENIEPLAEQGELL